MSLACSVRKTSQHEITENASPQLKSLTGHCQGWKILFQIFRIVSADCETVQAKIVQQMNDWDNEDCGTKPGDTEPHGQKCLYKVNFFYLYIYITL